MTELYSQLIELGYPPAIAGHSIVSGGKRTANDCIDWITSNSGNSMYITPCSFESIHKALSSASTPSIPSSFNTSPNVIKLDSATNCSNVPPPLTAATVTNANLPQIPLVTTFADRNARLEAEARQDLLDLKASLLEKKRADRAALKKLRQEEKAYKKKRQAQLKENQSNKTQRQINKEKKSQEKAFLASKGLLSLKVIFGGKSQKIKVAPETTLNSILDQVRGELNISKGIDVVFLSGRDSFSDLSQSLKQLGIRSATRFNIEVAGKNGQIPSIKKAIVPEQQINVDPGAEGPEPIVDNPNNLIRPLPRPNHMGGFNPPPQIGPPPGQPRMPGLPRGLVPGMPGVPLPNPTSTYVAPWANSTSGTHKIGGIENGSNTRIVFHLTGFGPFGSNKTNHSGTLANLLSSTAPPHLENASIQSSEILETSVKAVKSYLDKMSSSPTTFPKDILRKTHIVFIHLGLNNSTLTMDLETQGANFCQFTIPDVNGVTLRNRPVIPTPNIPLEVDLNKKLSTTLPLSLVINPQVITETAYVNKGFVMSRISNSAGGYICNFLYYSSLSLSLSKSSEYRALSRDCTVHSLFVHLPPVSIISLKKQTLFLNHLLHAIELALK